MASEILHSWKAVAAYLEKDVRTCSRWARDLGLPIHHVNGDSSRSKVFAYREEIDEWLRARPAGGLATEHRRRTTIRSLLIPGLAAGGTVIAVLAGWLVLRNPGAARAAGPSIAVAPFENLNPEAPNEYLTEGLTTEVANRLAPYGRVRLIPSAAVPDFNRAGKDQEQIRAKLGADYLIKGSLRKTGEAVQMRFEVIRVRDTVRVLNLEFDETMDRISYVIDNVRAKIMETIGFPGAPGPTPTSPRPAAAALDDVLKGRYLLRRLGEGERKDPWTLYHQGRYFSGLPERETNEIAISLFQEAIEADAGFADAYIGLADCYMNFINLAWDSQKTWLDKADALIHNALALDPDNPEGQAALILSLLLRNMVFEEASVQDAVSLAEAGLAKHPQHVRLTSIAGYAYFQRFGETGREEDFARALVCKEKAFWMDMYTIHNQPYAIFLMLNREYERALAVCEAMRTVDPEIGTLSLMAEIYYYQGDFDRCQAILESLSPTARERIYVLMRLAMIAAHRGRAEEAAKCLEKRALLLPSGPRDSHFREEINLASVQMGLGNRAKGLALLRAFFRRNDIGNYRYVYRKYVDIDKNFDAVRDTPEFKSALQGGPPS